MDSRQIERFVDKISCGKVITEQKLKNNSKIKLILYSPDPFDRAISSEIYENEYDTAISMGILTEKELMCFLIENGQWSVGNNIKIEQIRNDIQKITRGLLDFILQTTKLERARLMLREAERSLIELIQNKNSLLINTAENYAIMQQQRYIISKITCIANNKKLWENEINFEMEQDLELINKLTKLFFEESRIGHNILRLIARSHYWKTIWISSKNSNVLFNLSPTEWTENQKGLVYWSTVYDNVMESYERPTNKIIEDDDLMDSWFIRQSDKMDEQSSKNSVKDVVKDINKPGRKESFIITDAIGAKDVYKMNDQSAKIRLKAKEKMISKYGIVKEQDTPESQEEMRIQLTKQISSKGRN